MANKIGKVRMRTEIARLKLTWIGHALQSLTTDTTKQASK